METSIMELQEKSTAKKTERVTSSIVLYVAGVIVAILGIALLVTNVIEYKAAITQYVAQGYSAATVAKQLIPTQLIPAIFNSIGIYGGIAAVLIGAGKINTKVTKLFKTSVVGEVEAAITEVPETSEVEKTETK
jgi:hypothetical protein